MGVLHILISTFSPSALMASDVTAFCVLMILTISVQYGVGNSAFGSGSAAFLASFTFFIWWRMTFTIQYESSPRKRCASERSSFWLRSAMRL